MNAWDDIKAKRSPKYVICASAQQHAILSHPYVAALTPSCSIHLIMGGGWEKMPQCQWPSRWDSIITPINPSNTPISPPPFFPLFRSLSFRLKHRQRPHVWMTKLETLTLESANFNVFLKNNRLSQRQRPHLGSPEAALTAVIKECERMCAASVCVCVYSSSLATFSQFI